MIVHNYYFLIVCCLIEATYISPIINSILSELVNIKYFLRDANVEDLFYQTNKNITKYAQNDW